MKRTISIYFSILTIVLVTLAGCQMDLFDVVKQEVEAYKASQAGSPAITVLKGVDEVPEGGDIPIGPAVRYVGKSVTFSIENLGDAQLQLTGNPRLQIGGPHASEFSITTLPASVITPGGKSDFVIDFTPEELGDRTATLTIPNSASDDGEFDFTITGEGVTTATPEIQVTTGSTIIDEVQPYTYNFGNLAGNTGQNSFTISNIGTPGSTLTLFGSPTVQLGGTNPGMFAVTVQPDRTSLVQGVPGEDQTTFTVRYQPTSQGSHTATVTISNTDGNESPYSFDVTGRCEQVDVVFLVDVSGSMGSSINDIKANIGDTMASISALDVAARFGLATLNDFPIPPYGQGPEKPYELMQSLTFDRGLVENAVYSLYPAYGADMPGSHLEAMYQATTGEGLPAFGVPADPVGWRDNSLRVIVLVTDSPFHDPAVDIGYPGRGFGDTIDAMNAEAVEMIGLSLTYNLPYPDMQIIEANTGGVAIPTPYYETSAVMSGLTTLMSSFF
jgi:hypothetical protein